MGGLCCMKIEKENKVRKFEKDKQYFLKSSSKLINISQETSLSDLLSLKNSQKYKENTSSQTTVETGYYLSECLNNINAKFYNDSLLLE